MKKFRPTSAGRRGMTVVSYKDKLTSTKNAPHKKLTKGGRSTGGRNSQGRITQHYRGGGNKRTYRLIDFKFDKKDVPARVESVEYDPYRSGFVALVCYADGERRYILAPGTYEIRFRIKEREYINLGVHDFSKSNLMPGGFRCVSGCKRQLGFYQNRVKYRNITVSLSKGQRCILVRKKYNAPYGCR